ncbi:RNA polymerase I-specific transcription initiation factor RRN3 [Radiomyces spectabilis]|uniref:RNA polymerase I-specific transcription initiation factor RRN3 n=1 Tax=Radiomyces spectabilis TaxID=64574 RepID=UPI0022204FB0|nr:RNA polymerase I-specific transcription initiation factor RRN3 [Radiomyces spectabilis]KAI8365984.1 RNA polymerase I-specific transcription initiation factor RRN3 [Radiomyces spectabilis]
MDPNQDAAPSTAKLYIWISVLSQCVSQLDKSCATLVEATLHIDWAVRPRNFVDVYIDFLENLVSAHAFYVVPVLNMLVTGMKYRMRLPNYAVVSRSTVYERNHEALRCILQLIPTAASSLFVSIVRLVPHKRFSSADHAAYVKNILEIAEYVPMLRRQLLGLVIDHMVQVDAHIQIELDEMDDEVEFDIYHMDFDKDYESDASDDESDEDDEDDDSSVSSDIEDDSEDDERDEKKEEQIQKVQSMVRKLDAMMLLTFRYFAKVAINGPSDVRNEIYQTLIDIFDRVILKTLKSRYTQFLIFYFCSLDANAYSDHFLEHLLLHITDSLRPGITRIAAAAYMSSYVARAKFLEPSTIQRIVFVLCGWCETYVDTYEQTVHHLDASKHDVFYAVMQAIMYIFCFRWRELVIQDDVEAINEEEGEEEPSSMMMLSAAGGLSRNWCRGLHNMPRLIGSRFNPLKVCSPAVVRQFAKIAHQNHFMYVYPILEKNKELLISGVNATTGNNITAKNILQTVQTFFPFDPYKLEGSQSFIDNIYFEWIADDDDDDDSSDEEDEEDEDDDVSAGMMAMSISPSPTHFLQ